MKYEPLTLPLFTGCRDCDSVTGGRCWRHAISVTVVPTIIVKPTVATEPIQPVIIPLVPTD